MLMFLRPDFELLKLLILIALWRAFASSAVTESPRFPKTPFEASSFIVECSIGLELYTGSIDK